ncbi:transmembrane protein, putative (macronuclear) [Tetrahymena thermophila SB210]|uniref:Transmembrane protein, putative n=1 Tax=Tetrahymena thermophila (strain SB210) TaxID=312017 RepID=W7X3A2_TETTS|nr:transmembrane protein, putative [Tetrahymena thermophila SB210]EWS71927.1 transmembrane protein, putative [Tetrahymena thermophila SB210]|eukprot:XP_012655556.1 transmembrane protein, putative [Tetrahymena thermophila SB210]
MYIYYFLQILVITQIDLQYFAIFIFLLKISTNFNNFKNISKCLFNMNAFSQKLTSCIDYLSDPINGETNCCCCCLKLKPMNIVKILALQDILISAGLILVGINAILQIKIFNYYLQLFSTNSLLYGIVFVSSGGVIIVSLLVFYLANRKKNLKCFGLFYVILRIILFLAITAYSILLLICSLNTTSSSDPIYGFDSITKLNVQDQKGEYYGILAGIIAYSALNHFFSLILFLSFRYLSEGYEYERNINMKDKEIKQTFAPEWFRNQEVQKKNNLIKNQENQDQKEMLINQNKKNNDLEINKDQGFVDTKDTKQKTKISKNKVVPLNNDQKVNDDDIKSKSTKLIIHDENDAKNSMKIINMDGIGSNTSIHQLNQ